MRRLAIKLMFLHSFEVSQPYFPAIYVKVGLQWRLQSCSTGRAKSSWERENVENLRPLDGYFAIVSKEYL